MPNPPSWMFPDRTVGTNNIPLTNLPPSMESILAPYLQVLETMSKIGSYQPIAGSRAPLLPPRKKKTTRKNDGPAAPDAPVSGPASGGYQNPALTLGGSPWQKLLLGLLAQAKGIKGTKPTLSEGFLSQYLTNFDPVTRSETEASLAYDDSINSLQGQLGGIDRGYDGIMSDLDKWYGMLGDTNRAAAAANAENLEQNTGELGDATSAFISAIGGAANPGSASVAAEGVIGQGALRGMGQAQANFDNNVGQFFQAASASQKAGIVRQMARDRAELQKALAAAQRERGLYKSKATTGYDDDRLKLALQLRNNLYDQRKDASESSFNRILGLANLAGMASTIGSDVDQNTVDTASKVEDWKRAIILNEQERLRLQQFQQSLSGGGEQYPFSQLEPGTRAQLAGQLMTNLLGPKGYLTVNPKQFLNTVRQRLYGVAGYQRTPQTEAFIQELLEPRLINWWNKYHPKQRYNG